MTTLIRVGEFGRQPGGDTVRTLEPILVASCLALALCSCGTDPEGGVASSGADTAMDAKLDEAIAQVLVEWQPILDLRYEHAERQWLFPDMSPMNWTNALARGDQDSEGWAYLIRYGEFRKELVDTVLDVAIDEARCGSCEIASVGSTSARSDYDLSISGPESVTVIGSFNETFDRLFEEASATIFDTNLYAYPFFEEIDPARPVGGFATFKSDEKIFRHTAPVEDQALKQKDDDNQHRWAIIKYLLFANHEDIMTMTRALPAGSRSLELFLNSSAQKTALDSIIIDDQALDRDNVQLMNKAYEQVLKDTQSAEDALLAIEESAPNRDELGVEFKELVSKSTYYAQEAYLTVGAFFHVVGQTQRRLASVPVTAAEYFDSFMENVGDALKEVHGLEDTALEELNKNDCTDNMVRMSKYYFRSMDALARLDAASVESLNAQFAKSGLSDIESQRDAANDIRKTIRNKPVHDTCEGVTDDCVTQAQVEEAAKTMLGLPGATSCLDVGPKMSALAAGVMVFLVR